MRAMQSAVVEQKNFRSLVPGTKQERMLGGKEVGGGGGGG